MIGKVTFPAEPDAELILNDDLTWSCPEISEIAAAAAVLWQPRDISPAHGQPGYLWLQEAAKWLDGTVTFGPQPEPPKPDDTVARVNRHLGISLPDPDSEIVY